MNKKLVLFAMVVLVALSIGYYAAVQEVKNVSVEGFEVTSLSDLSVQSFTINGDLYIKNPSFFAIPVPTITYAVVLDTTGETISYGALPALTLESSAITTVPFAHTVAWVPTINLVLQLVTQERVFASVQGTVVIDFLGVHYDLPFERRVDIKPYVVQFATQKIDELKERILAYLP